eukprot:7402035-Alexandrium_andersonii.AAC.1
MRSARAGVRRGCPESSSASASVLRAPAAAFWRWRAGVRRGGSARTPSRWRERTSARGSLCCGWIGPFGGCPW